MCVVVVPGNLTIAGSFEVNRSADRSHNASTSEASTSCLAIHFGCSRIFPCTWSFLPLIADVTLLLSIAESKPASLADCRASDMIGRADDRIYVTWCGQHVGRETVGVEAEWWGSELVMIAEGSRKVQEPRVLV